ncbi:hypothetical protein [Catenisphaera adipataccumulans]|jgi:hypothetical protein|uniref:Uncharacterized protein (DUF58 family) n=1 Tax=Catenisphaera adipataccumulans TaxID=700500 RepID=A0A7W8CZC4_9FIRM|nr:hypothetical protein [Catenisphaera adipataccumulans]MBB5183107.1 uncharacterized protein (DUF58 family) [Catenisphaera adipataccumulans]
MAQRDFTCKYKLTRELIDEYVAATMKKTERFLKIAALLTWAAAIVILVFGNGLFYAVWTAAIGLMLYLDGQFLLRRHSASQLRKTYRKEYGSEEVEVQVRLAEVIHYRIGGTFMKCSYMDIKAVDETEHLMIFSFDDGTIPFLTVDLNDYQKEQLHKFIEKRSPVPIQKAG